MYRHHRLAVLFVLGLAFAGCSDDETSSPTTDPATSAVSTTSASTPTTTATATTAATATTSPTLAPTTSSAPDSVGDQTLGLWPPGGAETPEQAVLTFVDEFFDVDPNIGEFRAGDARSGEIDVLGPEEAGGVRATAFVRQLGPGDRWYVIGAGSDGVQITEPATGASVAPGPVAVEGFGRGFESTINVRALIVDVDATELDSAIGAGGPFGELEPFDVTLDLADAQPGDTVVLIARGDTGLSDDPGEFSTIALTVE